MQINLLDGMPVGADGKRSLLPKQAQFFQAATDPNSAKFICYSGGVGSGKTKIGCLTVLAWAVTTPGVYLVARQFSPELAVTTLKEFREMIPKELLIEERIADKIFKIRSAGGKISEVIFRPAEEPEKWRSLNLSGAYLDEASQVSEAAFTLLQGRLRGPGLRKIILTTNPNGHTWIYHWFIKQGHIKQDSTKKQFLMIMAPSTENIHLPEGYVQSMMETWSTERIQREIMGSWDSFEGQVYSDFQRNVHVIKPFNIPSHWTRVIGADSGFRNETAWIWLAVDGDDNVYVYKEFYQKEWLIEEVCKGKDGRPGVVEMMKGETIQQVRIDPSTKAVKQQTGGSDFSLYLDHLPEGFPLFTANNEVNTGLERVKEYLKLDPKTNKPKLFIFETCENVIDEMTTYRYEELPMNAQGNKNESEKPKKVHDHAMDALRYAVMCLPEPAQFPKDEWKKKYKYRTLEYSLREEIESIRNPKKSDPFEGGV